MDDGATGTMDDSLLGMPVEAVARRHALRLLHKADAAAARLLAGTDGEPLHDFRVALRRLRAWLGAYGAALGLNDKVRTQLRDLSRLTAKARDADVGLVWAADQRAGAEPAQTPGIALFAGLLAEERDQAYAALAAEVGASWAGQHARLAKRLERSPGGRHAPFAAVAARSIAAHARHFSDLRDKLQTAADIGLAHRCRIAGKHLRYLLEPLGGTVAGAAEAADELAALQDTLGDLHDAGVMLYRLIDATESAAMEEAKAQLRRILRGEIDEAGVAATGCPTRPGLLTLALRARHRETALFQQSMAQLQSPRTRTLLARLDAIRVSLEQAAA